MEVTSVSFLTQAVFKAVQKKGLRSRRALCRASAEPETGTAIEESEKDGGELEVGPRSQTEHPFWPRDRAALCM